jgi:hypothetical protein
MFELAALARAAPVTLGSQHCRRDATRAVDGTADVRAGMSPIVSRLELVASGHGRCRAARGSRRHDDAVELYRSGRDQRLRVALHGIPQTGTGDPRGRVAGRTVSDKLRP